MHIKNDDMLWNTFLTCVCEAASLQTGRLVLTTARVLLKIVEGISENAKGFLR